MWAQAMGPAGYQVYPEYLSDPYVGKCPSSTQKGFESRARGDIGQGPDLNQHSFLVDLGSYSGATFVPLPAEDLATWCQNGNSCAGETPYFGTYRPRDAGGNRFIVVNFDYTYTNRLIKLEWVANALTNCELAYQLISGESDDFGTQYGVNTLAKDRAASVSCLLTGFGAVNVQSLKEGIERFLITDINNPAAAAAAQSTLPVMWDQAKIRGGYSGQAGGGVNMFNHVPGGSNLLYMDGHVQFAKYPSPVSQSTWPVAKESLDRYTAPAGWNTSFSLSDTAW
jgi:prepilin-type processing-associated H-X9-DG protein